MSHLQQLIVLWSWLAITGIGIGLTGTMMYWTHGDLKLLQTHGVTDGIAGKLTALAFWQEFRRFCVKLFLFSVGVESFFSPKVPEVCRTSRAVYSWIFIVLLFTVVALMNYSTLQAMRFRRYFLNEATKEV